MNIVACIQARMGSARFPGKILADIEGKAVVDRVVERAQQIRGVDHVVLAYPLRDDDVIKRHFSCKPRDLILFPSRCDTDDVLGRFDEVASSMRADVVMRLTADCPLLDPWLAAHVLEEHLAELAPRFTHNIAPNTDGFDVEVFTARQLRLANLRAETAYDREHVTPWMHGHLPARHVSVRGACPKLSVDTEEELETVRALYRAMKKDVFRREEVRLIALERKGDYCTR